jgi:tyrosinase
MREIQSIGDNRGYNHIAGSHGVPNWCYWHTRFISRTPLTPRLFLPWHRAYLWWLEQALQDRLEGVALPYEEWTTQPDILLAYTSSRVGNRANPLFSARIYVPTARPRVDKRTQRGPGRNPNARLPTRDEVEWVRGDPDWASFFDRLELFHDSVHTWVGGDMMNQDFAAWEQLFWAHH